MEREIVVWGMKWSKEHCDKKSELIISGLKAADWMDVEIALRRMKWSKEHCDKNRKNKLWVTNSWMNGEGKCCARDEVK
jgi:hypothetical protein